MALSVNKESMNQNSSKNVFLRFYFFNLLHLLVAAYGGAFRTWSNIYNGALLLEILGGFKLLTIFAKNFQIRCLTGVKMDLWTYKWTY